MPKGRYKPTKRKKQTTRTAGTDPNSPPSLGTINPNIPSTVPGLPSVLAPSTNTDIINRGQQLGIAQAKPQMDALTTNAKAAESAHRARIGDIGNWGQMAQAALNKAFGGTRDAVNQLITSTGATNAANAGNLASVLRGAGQQNADLAAQLGVADPTAAGTQATLATGAAGDKATQEAVGSGAGVLLGMMGAQQGLAPVQVQQLQQQEDQRYQGVLQDIMNKRTDLASQLPGQIQQNVKDLQQFELAKAQFGEQRANDLFQQFLADKQFKLSAQNQTFQQWLGAAGLSSQVDLGQQGIDVQQGQLGLDKQKFIHQQNIDWAQIGIQQGQLKAQIAQIEADARKADNTTDQENAKLRAQAWNTALTWLSDWMKPRKGEAAPVGGKFPFGKGGQPQTDDQGFPLPKVGGLVPKTTDYQRLFANALNGLIQHGLSKRDALTILRNSEYSDWRKKAAQMLIGPEPGSGGPVSRYTKGKGKPD